MLLIIADRSHSHSHRAPAGHPPTAEDWYPTISNILGIDPSDEAMMNGTARPIDGIDVWDAITAGAKPEREWLPVTEVRCDRTDKSVHRSSREEAVQD